MSLPLPIVNCRLPQEVTDALDLRASRSGQTPGPLMREWIVERLAMDATMDCLKSFGLM